MAARRASLRPQSPPLAQRALIAVVVVFTVGSFVCLHSITSGDWPIDAPAIISSHLRSSVELSVLDRAMNNLQSESGSEPKPEPHALRAFLKQRASVLSDDQSRVVGMAKHAWSAYQEFAEWSDELDVEELANATKYGHDMAFTTVDSLDTLLIMGMHDEFGNASEWIKWNLEETMYASGNVSMQDTLTRSLGGLLSAFYLSGDQHFLQIADNLGQHLEKGFNCGIFVPCRQIDFEAGMGYFNPPLAEASSFQLEFRYLSELSTTPGYVELIDNFNALSTDLATDFFNDGLVPVSINWEQIKGIASNVSFGALGDSYFEYQLKQWILTGKKDDTLKQSYLTAISGLKERMLGYSSPSNLTFIGLLLPSGKLVRRMDHSSCSVPGLLALGIHHGLPRDHLDLAEELIETCMQMYLRSTTILAPEAVRFTEPSEDNTVDSEIVVVDADDCNHLGAETVESLMVLYRVTKDNKYREYGRQIIEAIETNAKVETGGYRSTRHVFSGPVEPLGRSMPSSFLSETIKYLFLLFSEDDVLSLDAVVFNTRAHPFPILVESSSS